MPTDSELRTLTIAALRAVLVNHLELRWPGWTLGEDQFGDTTLHIHADGSLWWHAYEWEEREPKREATDAEVLWALAEHARNQREREERDAPFVRLGRAAVEALKAAGVGCE